MPATITAITAETIERAGVERAEDFIALTPGVTIVDAAEVGDTQVNIRGINGARDAENSFAFILDGVLQTNPAAFNREFTDLQQIEIFKGPQGAIYGRNAAAGAIIVTTRMPTNEFEGLAKLSFGDDNTFVGQAAVSGPIVEDRLFFRVSGDWRETDGFYRNSFQDNAPIVDDFESQNFNVRLVFTPNDDVTVDTKFRYGQVDAASIAFNAAFALPAFAFANPLFNEDVNDHEFVFQPNIDP
ncbi:MAG: TonB-dependent receptor plug domain-containing protein, partial [Caulobacterales bacterium]|nr:TonB-dependent receptor plug domain-containing protein [Caulobacterales bacterium]